MMNYFLIILNLLLKDGENFKLSQVGGLKIFKKIYKYKRSANRVTPLVYRFVRLLNPV